ncbi:MAG: DMT family transporter [Chitinophagaceae bacterium]|nr:DMT family transporter [Chitinophagaceae bacterium]
MKNWKAHAAVLAANLIFGINFSTVQFVTKKFIGPFGLNVLRVAVSTVLLWILILFSNTKAGIEKKDLGRFLLCSLTGVVINQMLFIKGLSMTLSIHASLLILVTPLFITGFAAWLGLERLTFLKIAGLITGISGAVMLSLDRKHGGNNDDVFWGDIFIIINAISYAFYFVLVKPLMQRYNPVHVVRWVFTFSLILVIPLGWEDLRRVDWAMAAPTEIAAIIFIVIGATFFAYLFNLYGIHHLGAGITGTYIYTQPVFAAIIAVLVLNEVFTVYKALAAFLILIGVFLVGLKKTGKQVS